MAGLAGFNDIKMKFRLIIAMLVLAACHSSQPKVEEKKFPTSLVNIPITANGIDAEAAAMKPVMTFKDTLHDFGTMHENEVVQYEFAFTNTGKTPLIITAASAACGCTVAEYPKEPIAPGTGGVL